MIPVKTTSIGNDAFSGCNSLTVYFEEGTTEIPQTALAGASVITVVMPPTVIKIGNKAFKSCSNLSSINIPKSVMSIGSESFNGCSSLIEVSIPSNVTNIESGTFRYCSSIIELEIPSSVVNIGDNAFEYCSKLKTINIPNSVTSIGKYAFAHCRQLTRVVISANAARIGNCAFYDCNELKVVFAEGTTCIPYEALSFYNGWGRQEPDYGIVSIEIPSSVNTIKNGALLYCYGLVDIFYNSSIEDWNSIEKVASWDSKGSYTIHCIDGDILKERPYN